MLGFQKPGSLTYRSTVLQKLDVCVCVAQNCTLFIAPSSTSSATCWICHLNEKEKLTGTSDRMRVLLFSVRSNIKIHDIRSRRAVQRRDRYVDWTKKCSKQEKLPIKTFQCHS